MKWIFICVSFLFLAFGCSKPSDSELESEAGEGNDSSNVVSVNTGLQKSTSDLLAEEETAGADEKLSSETDGPVSNDFEQPAGAVPARLELNSCRGDLTQLKQSCEFMPEWLKNVQASGEDVTIERNKHGVTVVWNSGTFEGGSFKGLWKNGSCRGGVMESVVWDQGVFDTGCVWKNGLWKDGVCQAEDCSHTVN